MTTLDLHTYVHMYQYVVAHWFHEAASGFYLELLLESQTNLYWKRPIHCNTILSLFSVDTGCRFRLCPETTRVVCENYPIFSSVCRFLCFVYCECIILQYNNGGTSRKKTIINTLTYSSRKLAKISFKLVQKIYRTQINCLASRVSTCDTILRIAQLSPVIMKQLQRYV